jgi:phage I-like protein
MAKFALALVQARYGQLDDLKRRAASRAEKSAKTESPSATLAKQTTPSYLPIGTVHQVTGKVVVVPHLVGY